MIIYCLFYSKGHFDRYDPELDALQTRGECRAGKPEILTVSDTTVQLRWTAPEHHVNEVDLYLIFYFRASDSGEKWEVYNQLVHSNAERVITIQ